MLVTFLVFGAALLPEALEHVDASIMAYAVVSLTLIRMVTIALSLLGLRIRLPTYLFLGWFGLRGLVSILFVPLILEQTVLTYHAELLSITVTTVALSVLLHGLSAAPLAKRYGRLTARMGECEVRKAVCDKPLRGGPSTNDSMEPRP